MPADLGSIEDAPVASEGMPSPAEGSQSSKPEGYPTCPRRGPLRAIVRAATGEDVRLCANCNTCDQLFIPGMDLTLGEIVRAAGRNELEALTNRSLWACEDLLLRPIPCQAGLDLPAIIFELQREAELRGLAPQRPGATA